MTISTSALHAALTRARRPDVERVTTALQQTNVVGVHGEGEVGKTTIVNAAMRELAIQPIRLDLDGVTDTDDVAWLLARGLIAWMVRAGLAPGVKSFSMLELSEDLRPVSVRRGQAHLAHTLGVEFVDFALRREETTTHPHYGEVIERIVGAIAAANGRTALWIDHLETPGLIPRHPVDVSQLLWAIRSATQNSETVPVLMSGAQASSEVAHGPKRAFYGDGTWVQIDRPRGQLWEAVAEEVDVAPVGWASELADLTGDHPATTLLGLVLRSRMKSEVRTGGPPAQQVWETISALDSGLTARTVQYGRQLHRLGASLLQRVAEGEGPYEGARDQAARKELHKATQRLHRAGLLTQPAPRTWAVTNPVVEAQLGGEAARRRRSSRHRPVLERSVGWE